MSATEEYFVIDEFYGGIVRDEQSETAGAALNLEEIDILDNENYFQAEHILQEKTNIDSDISDYLVYDFSQYKAYDEFGVYGATSSGSVTNLAEIEALDTIFSSLQELRQEAISDENTPRPMDEIEVLRTSEDTASGPPIRQYTEWIYFTKEEDTQAPRITRYDSYAENVENVGTLEESEIGSVRVPTIMRIIQGELYIFYSNTINKVASDGTFTQDWEVLDRNYDVVDVTTVGRDSRSMFVLCSPVEPSTNQSRGYWINIATASVDDYIDIPYGGAQWVNNIGSDVMMAFVENGRFRMRKLSQPYPGSTSQEIPNIDLRNIREPTSLYTDSTRNQLFVKPSPAKSVHNQYGSLYFILNKEDAPGIYRVGRMDKDYDYGISLAHKFPGNYPNQIGLAAGVYGEKKIVSYLDGFTGQDTGTPKIAELEPDSDGTRSSNAVYESVWTGAGDVLPDKQLKSIHVVTHPLPANTEVKVYAAKDYEDSYTEIFRRDGTTMDGTGDTVGVFQPTPIRGASVFRVKIELVSNGEDTPKVTTVGFTVTSENNPSHK